MNSKSWCGVPSLAIALLAWFSVEASAAEPSLTRRLLKTSHVYKTVGDVKIEADVYTTPSNEAIRPVLVWIHGGALIVGSRTQVPKNLHDYCEANEIILVSLDYRLAPEVKLPEITADLDDAFRWLHEVGEKRFRADTKKMIVAGGSAGGYLTLLSATRMPEKPVALLTYWGYGDLGGAWATSASTHHGEPLTAEEKAAADQVIGKQVLTHTDDPPVQKARGAFYRSLRQNGSWGKTIAGIDPKDTSAITPYCPVRNIKGNFPPTLMIHGTADTDVAYSCAVDLAEAMKRANVRHELISIPNGEHGLRGGDPKLIEAAHTRALEFLSKEFGLPNPQS